MTKQVTCRTGLSDCALIYSDLREGTVNTRVHAEFIGVHAFTG